ncbi:MAG TPA: hypothetical protein VFQ35_08335 [Polyangiaceae bacterium]|nr:hypothetical protein [Polyangiaceae bacterium]
MRFVVATHGHCFDGLASAALFTRLQRELGAGAAEFEYRACGYSPGQPHADDAVLNGDDNAILDYRFSPSPRLTWYFDHHRTAFETPQDRAIFEGRNSPDRLFHDAAYSSCTKLVADVARERFGVTMADLGDLVSWADRVDSARFESAEQAVSRSDPVMRFVSVVEHYGDDAFFTRVVPQLLSQPLEELARSGEVERRFRPLGKKHDRFVQRVRDKGERRGRVVFVDLTETVLDTVGKFVTYALFPDSVYSVIVGLLKSGPKISVGYNPWSGRPRDADISAICARYGGGGHPVVGGIAFRANEVERARLVANQIANELAG